MEVLDGSRPDHLVKRSEIMSLKTYAHLFIVCLLFLTAATSVSAETLAREYQIKQAGTNIGTATIEIFVLEHETYLNTVVTYPQMGAEIHSNYIFSGSEFPKQPLSYNFSIISGGVLDLEMNWGETTQYTIKQLGQTIKLAESNVLALDNNTISDYMVATWIYDKTTSGTLQSNLVVPVLLPQGTQLLPMTISYVGDEPVDHYKTEHYQVDIGVGVDIWVDQTDRSLVKLNIPMQAYEITATDIESKPEVERVFKDFGGYDFQEADFHIDVERATLSGTMTIPKVDGKLPGVVLVAGSGPTDRDGNNYLIPGPADYLKEIAHYLASRGVIVLRYDKRGVGESPGEIHSFGDYISDISALFDLLSNLSNVDSESLYIVGHSEGAWLASEVARKRHDLAGIGLLSGAGFPFFDTIKRQILVQSDAAIAAGLFDSGLSERSSQALDDMYQSLLNNTDYDVSQYNLPTEIEQLILSFIYQKDILTDWLVVDPAQVLSEVEVPVLIIQGTADTQIQVADAQVLAAALPEEQRELHIFKGLDHVLKMTYGEPLPYTDPERRVDLMLLHTLGDWIAGD